MEVSIVKKTCICQILWIPVETYEILRINFYIKLIIEAVSTVESFLVILFEHFAVPRPQTSNSCCPSLGSQWQEVAWNVIWQQTTSPYTGLVESSQLALASNELGLVYINDSTGDRSPLDKFRLKEVTREKVHAMATKARANARRQARKEEKVLAKRYRQDQAKNISMPQELQEAPAKNNNVMVKLLLCGLFIVSSIAAIILLPSTLPLFLVNPATAPATPFVNVTINVSMPSNPVLTPLINVTQVNHTLLGLIPLENVTVQTELAEGIQGVYKLL